MAEHKGYDALDDKEFERLFSALDDVKASEELKASTLAAIFAQVDADEETTEASETRPSGFVLIEGGTSTHVKASDGIRQKRKNAYGLRVAAVLLVLALAVGGGVAYSLPATHVYATAGNTTFDLGVNVFGFTVSAEADSEDGKEVLQDAKVRNVRFADALDRILNAYDLRGGEDSPTIRVETSTPFGGGDLLDEQAKNVMSTHEQRRMEYSSRSNEENPQNQSYEQPHEDERQEPVEQTVPARPDNDASNQTADQPTTTNEDRRTQQEPQPEQAAPPHDDEKSQSPDDHQPSDAPANVGEDQQNGEDGRRQGMEPFAQTMSEPPAAGIEMDDGGLGPQKRGI